MKYTWDVTQYKLDDCSILEFSDEVVSDTNVKATFESIGLEKLGGLGPKEKATFSLLEEEKAIYMYGILDGSWSSDWNVRPAYVSFFGWLLAPKIEKYQKVLEHHLSEDRINILSHVDQSWRTFVDFEHDLNDVEKYCNRFGVHPDETPDFLLGVKASIEELDDVKGLKVSLDDFANMLMRYLHGKQFTEKNKKVIAYLLNTFNIVVCMLDGYVYVLSQEISVVQEKLKVVASEYDLGLKINPK